MFGFSTGDIEIHDKGSYLKAFVGDFGKVYELPQGMYYHSQEAKTYLGGKTEFMIEEMEVYELS